MMDADALDPSLEARASVVVDLIGDLDATLGETVSTMLEHYTSRGGADLYVSCKHVTGADAEGLAALSRAVAAACVVGSRIVVVPGSRRLGSAFKAARIAHLERDLPRAARERHVMIAHHGAQRAPTRPARIP